MEQLLAHLTGDYLIQNNWMARNKESNSFACLIHCILYTMCFWFLASWPALAVIFVTHFVVDRTGVVKKISNWAMGDAPDFLKVFVAIARDNTVHLLCNYFAILYLG